MIFDFKRRIKEIIGDYYFTQNKFNKNSIWIQVTLILNKTLKNINVFNRWILIKNVIIKIY